MFVYTKSASPLCGCQDKRPHTVVVLPIVVGKLQALAIIRAEHHLIRGQAKLVHNDIPWHAKAWPCCGAEQSRSAWLFAILADHERCFV